VLREGYQVTADHEAMHWWFTSRRELVLLQARRAAAEIGFPRRRLRVLEYGCGTGFTLPFLAEFGEVVGADVADEALGEFRRSTGFPLLDLRRDLTAWHGTFDLVTALDVLEHTDDDVAGLAAMRRFLAAGGQMLLTVPAYAWLWSGEDVISQHRRRYTKAALVRVCRAAGLVPRWVSYFNLTILPAMAAMVWGRRLFAADSEPRSNIRPTAPWLNRLLHGITSREAHLVGHERLALPAGASLICRLEAAG
jgi:SAM-dependent methyltransferase